MIELERRGGGLSGTSAGPILMRGGWGALQHSMLHEESL